MNTWRFLVVLLILSACTKPVKKDTNADRDKTIALVIHGGAGYITPERLDSVAAQAYRDTLQLALEAGYAILKEGGAAIDAVQACIQILEDCSLFNAGRGATYNSLGQQEMDASIMDGRDRASQYLEWLRGDPAKLELWYGPAV